MRVSADIRRQVRERAGFACEYNGVSETDAGGERTVQARRVIRTSDERVSRVAWKMRMLQRVVYFDMEAVHRYEGYVVQSSGDGIFALFGAPIAHEDHPSGRCTRRCGCRRRAGAAPSARPQAFS